MSSIPASASPAPAAPQGGSASDPAKQRAKRAKAIWLLVAFAAAAVVLFLPFGDSLGVAGHRALAILVFAVIVWITEAVSYPVSAFIIMALIALLIGLAPDPDAPDDGPIGTAAGLKQALGGFSNSAWSLVMTALFLAVAMKVTNLHRRIALWVLRAVGQRTDAVLAGVIIVSIVLAFFVPSATARAGAVVPILMGMVAAFGLAADSKLAALLMITAVQSVSIWNVGIKTAAAQNFVADGFIRDQYGTSPSWGEWFVAAAPWAAIMSVLLFFIMRVVVKPEVSEIEGGRDLVKRQLDELGPVSAPEWRLIIVSVLLLAFWATEDRLHPIDASTVTLVAIAVLFLPKIGVFSWSETKGQIDWGTIIVFGVGISLGTVLLNTGAATWLSEATFGRLGLAHAPLLLTIAVVALFNILIHLGFASATSLAAALIPVFIALAQSLPLGQDQQIGFVLIQQFVISFGFLLPISAPQNMLAYGTGAFTSKQFFKAGLPLTVAGFVLILLFSATYWRWIGLL